LLLPACFQRIWCLVFIKNGAVDFYNFASYLYEGRKFYLGAIAVYYVIGLFIAF